MAEKVKILIAGIGGVGGYFGGLLARKFEKSEEVTISFLARGEHLSKIRTSGLKVIKGDTEFIARPTIATDDANEIGVVDFILVCTKSYDLDQTILQLKPCIGENTIILPLLNGVESVDRIRKILPETIVPEGCVYIVSKCKEAGVIENSGINQLLFFGPGEVATDRLTHLEKIMQEAGIVATLSDTISTIVWEKYIFISAIATATSYLDSCIGKLIEENEESLIQLLEEAKSVAEAKGIVINPGITSNTINYNKLLPYETTSSMHRDYLNGKQNTEVEFLTGYIVRAGKELGIKTPLFEKAYDNLRLKSGV